MSTRDKAANEALAQQKVMRQEKWAGHKARVMAIHAADPELPACVIADRLGLSKGLVMKWVRALREETIQ